MNKAKNRHFLAQTRFPSPAEISRFSRLSRGLIGGRLP
jgi:hypothetical protein